MMSSQIVPQGYKQTKVGVIPVDWDVVKIGKVLTIGSGKDYKHLESGDIPVYGTGGYMLSVNKYLYDGESVCIGRKGTIDKPMLLNGKFWTVDTLFYSHSYINSIPKFIYYNFLTINWKKYNEASGVPSLSKKTIETIFVALPPLKEQEKIAKILTTWDDAISTQEKLIQAKEELKKGLMQKLLSGEVRFDGFSEDWKNISLSDFLISISREVNKPNSNYLSIGIKSHCKGTFQKPNFNPDKIMMGKLYLVKENDLIVNITFAWEGAIAIVKKEDENGLVSHRFPTYNFNKDLAIYEFFKYVFIQKRFRYMLDLISPGGAGRNRVMSKKEFLKLKWEMPSIKEQEYIAEVLTTADKEIILLENELKELKEQKKGLMQKLLTGEVRVNI